uniref:Methylosome subunit pICln n=1 Tax=Ditylenchus dipsaci TaxID=166011 RepID=A0A915ESK6_9BILA
MLVLQDIPEPREDVLSAQPQVIAYWEKDCLGQGTLFLTNRIVVWIADATKKGFRLSYRQLRSMRLLCVVIKFLVGFSGALSFLMIDVNKTDIDYTPELESVEDEIEKEIKTAAIRFIPSDPSAISLLFETMNECQEQNPEEDEDMSNDSDEEGEEEMIDGQGISFRTVFINRDFFRFTSDNTGDEIHLSAEGRQNLERMLGNLNDLPNEGMNDQPGDENQQHGQHNGDAINQTMLVLQDIPEPREDVLSAQPQVIAYWEKDCLGQGTLFLTNRIVVWIADATKKGFRLSYPSIAVHAASGSSEDFPEPCLFLMIDVNKTDIDYTPELESVEDEIEKEIKTAAIRFIPSDPSAISLLFETMNECQEQNPEEDEDMSNDSDEEGEEEMIDGQGDQLSDSGRWFTSDNTGDEIHLSAEGRQNLERMLGNLNDLPNEGMNDQPGDENQQHGQHNGDSNHQDSMDLN